MAVDWSRECSKAELALLAELAELVLRLAVFAKTKGYEKQPQILRLRAVNGASLRMTTSI